MVVTADSTRDDVIQATLKKLHVKNAASVTADYRLVAEATNECE